MTRLHTIGRKAEAKKNMARQALQSSPAATAPVDNVRTSNGTSSPDQVVRALIDGVKSGRYVPGQRLIEADLTAELKVSRGPVREALNLNPAKLAPCHCDPLCENFLDSGERMWIVDWEYSGMNDPLWDLGDLSVEAGFTPAQDRELIRAYCGGNPSDADFGRMIIYKAMCDLLWTLWGLIQHSDNNPAEDFWAYSIGRFERCKTLMSTPEFERHVQAVGKGI